ncbi:unnamed protein product [Candidula unifasciata]|uniref:Crossover junction endonuclease MUS81 n=1 Tax=Candidula unifasciata TaxID=100452 RepID=A0A8S3ZJ22_9EUPU|nr:unnamed protein product [Candidula unifasciata]
MSESGVAASTSLKGKRKKKLPPNPNPLFTQWLTEWKQEAVEKGWKSAHVYAKALKTIRLFPLPLASGKDCRLLQNFEKLFHHEVSGCNCLGLLLCPGSASARTSKSPSLPNTGGSEASASDTEIRSSPQKKKSRAAGSRGREYVPAYRSGPYALVLTLYRFMQDPEFKGYMTKSELSHAAQPLSDKSFTVPEPGSHYTAWSSMGVLIKKGFFFKSNSPARYSLTDEGYLLGQRLHSAEVQDNVRNEPLQVSSRTDSSQAHSLPPGNLEIRSDEISPPNFSCLQYKDISTDDDDDGDLARAVTQSLLSYSQERAARSSVPASFTPASRVGHQYNSAGFHDGAAAADAGSDGVDLNDSILVVSDEDMAKSPVLPTRTWARFHSLSPSQSSPPQYTGLARLPRSEPSLQDEPINSLSASSVRNSNTDIDQTRVHYPDKSLHFDGKSPSAYHEDILEISDDDTDKMLSMKMDDINTFVTKKVENVAITNFCESDSDELPDLDIPLWKRLAQKGHAESGLLKNLASTLAQSSTSQKVLCNTNQKTEIILKHQHKDHFSQVKDNLAMCNHQTNKATTEPCNTLYKDPIYNSSHFAHYSSSVLVHNTHNLVGTDTVGTAPMTVLMEKSAPGTYENSRNGICTSSLSTHITTSETTSLVDCCPSFTLLPGSFDIILCIDNREFYGSKGCSKTLLPDLMKCGITCDLRLLHVGDLLWIARERGGQRLERKGRELVLHYIIERKRMDDLVSSMTDGRMKEQKFRLKHCGLSEPIILIEEYGSIKNFSISEDRIKQSIVNSQVIDGFKVKRCASAKDAVTYISTMTHFLTQHYSTKTLHAVSLDQLKLLRIQQPLQKQEHYLIPFDVFNEASVKQKDLSVRELFAKHLIQVPGVSADRAKAITSAYPSFSHLMTAYERCADDKDRQKLLSGIKCGKKERNLGNALSNILCLLYTQKGSLL